MIICFWSNWYFFSLLFTLRPLYFFIYFNFKKKIHFYFINSRYPLHISVSGEHLVLFLFWLCNCLENIYFFLLFWLHNVKKPLQKNQFHNLSIYFTDKLKKIFTLQIWSLQSNTIFNKSNLWVKIIFSKKEHLIQMDLSCWYYYSWQLVFNCIMEGLTDTQIKNRKRWNEASNTPHT